LYVVDDGLYMVFVGQHSLYLAGTRDVSRVLNGHFAGTGTRVRPLDMVGRELMDYARRYHLPLTIKLAEVFGADGAKVSDQGVFDDLVHLLVYRHLFACNLHGRDEYQGAAPIELTNTGKHFPLESHYTS
jgi:hypothetical protein